jgi:hypothetical protein
VRRPDVFGRAERSIWRAENFCRDKHKVRETRRLLQIRKGRFGDWKDSATTEGVYGKWKGSAEM